VGWLLLWIELLRSRLLILGGILAGGASWMVRPLASDSEREALPTDVHGVDHKRSALGARQLRAADAQ
jgi:hypothetical protein